MASRVAADTGPIWIYNLRSLLGDEPTLLSAEIKERPLKVFASSRQPGKAQTSATVVSFQHDYVVITSLGKYGTEVVFVVEKLNRTQREIHGASLRDDPRADTYVNIVLGIGAPRQESNRRFRADLQKTRVSMNHLEAILVANGQSYKLLSSNCWEYAFGITRELVSRCPQQGALTELDNSLTAGPPPQPALDGVERGCCIAM